MSKTLTTSVLAICLGGFALSASAQTIFDDFNTSEGHFNLQPSFSGSTAGILTSSTADRVETDSPLEGIGHQKLVLGWNGTSSAIVVRHLSGGGTIANNTPFTTSSGTDGWIGFYVKTLSVGWTAQPWIESASVNFGTAKPIISDGQWHLYEWNLDDTTGGANGWGSGIITGTATVADGSHTFDSIVFRDSTPESSSTLFLDYVARNPNGSVGLLVPEPSSAAFGLLGLGLFLWRKSRK